MKVGDRVICVKPIRIIEIGVQNPIVGGEYTVRCIEEDAMAFEEIVNKKKRYFDGYGEALFHMRYFRKLETYKATENCVNFDMVEEGLEEPQLA
jgi:hypothetical protein